MTLREKIADLIDTTRKLQKGEMIIAPDQAADAILAAIREHVTSPKAAIRYLDETWGPTDEDGNPYTYEKSTLRTVSKGILAALEGDQ